MWHTGDFVNADGVHGDNEYSWDQVTVTDGR